MKPSLHNSPSKEVSAFVKKVDFKIFQKVFKRSRREGKLCRLQVAAAFSAAPASFQLLYTSLYSPLVYLSTALHISVEPSSLLVYCSTHPCRAL